MKHPAATFALPITYGPVFTSTKFGEGDSSLSLLRLSDLKNMERTFPNWETNHEHTLGRTHEICVGLSLQVPRRRLLRPLTLANGLNIQQK